MSVGHELPLALRVAYLTLHRKTSAVLALDGVTAEQFVVLLALADAEPLTQTELVERTGSDHNTLRAMLVLLEKRGLIARRPHPTDRRARHVRLTAQGRRLSRRLVLRSEMLRERMGRALSGDDTATLIALLQRLTQALEQEPATPVPA